MDFAVVSTDTIVRMKKRTTIVLNTQRIIDPGITEHCALLNGVPGVSVLWSCEGHLIEAGKPEKKPYLVLACSQQGRAFLAALFRNLLSDPVDNYTEIGLTQLELPWVGNDADYATAYSDKPEDYYYAWSIRCIVSGELDIYRAEREMWLDAIKKTIKQFS